MSRPRLYTAEAIVLRSSPIGEADRLLTVLTPWMGKLRITARGVRRPKSKLGGHLEPLTRSTLTIAKGQNLDTVTGADAREMFSALKGDLPLLSAALYLTELVDSLNPLESPNPPGYSTYLDGLRAIETGNKVDLTLRYLEICLLGQAGFSPELRQCVECGSQVTEGKHRFSARAGGVLCPACQASMPGVRPLSLEALKVLRFFSTATLSSSLMVNVGSALQHELNSLMDSYVRYTLERELRSASFLRSIENMREVSSETAS